MTAITAADDRHDISDFIGNSLIRRASEWGATSRCLARDVRLICSFKQCTGTTGADVRQMAELCRTACR
ncbi:hypothetical protein [Bradyrhizobium sp. HKCCYLR20261]|uniref:hypothetical protein n=1 Tax=Bradyrhizobium sp. HKCCYLR20261 TaxID=3420760 RepID=UPI003EB877D8